MPTDSVRAETRRPALRELALMQGLAQGKLAVSNYLLLQHSSRQARVLAFRLQLSARA